MFAALHDANRRLVHRDEKGAVTGRTRAGHHHAICPVPATVGQRIRFLGDRRWWTIEAADDSRLVCARGGDLGRGSRYTVVEWGAGRRGPHDSFGHGAGSRAQCEEVLAALASGAIALSERNSVYLDLDKVETGEGSTVWPG